MRLLIYIPALNEEENIRQVIDQLPQSLDNINFIQYLVIDDGSTDRTRNVSESAGAQVVCHDRNRGVGAAFHTAVQYALENKVDILVGIDADGQFDPAEIPALIAPILANQTDMVIGNRFHSGMPEHMPKIKYWGNKQVAKIISYVGSKKFQDVSCGFRAYSCDALLHLNLFGAFTYTHETILSLLYQEQRVMELPIKVKYYPGRVSRTADSVLAYALRTSKIIFRVLLDYQPLRVFGGFGSALILIGVVFVFFMLGHYVLTQTFTPYKSFGFIGLGFFIFGLFVILIALIADMLNRIRINQEQLLYKIKKLEYGQ